MRIHFTAALAAALLVACGGDVADQPRQANNQQPNGVTSGTRAMAANNYYDLVQRIYVAYFGRPADAGGLTYFANLLAAANAPATAPEFANATLGNKSLLAIIDVFSTSQESKDMYAGDTSLFLDAVYQNLFNRAPDEAGKAFWIKQLEAGTMSRSTAAVQIMAGARSTDSDIITNKIKFASGFTAALNDSSKTAAYSGLEANAVVRSLLSQVKASTSASSVQTKIDTTLSGLLGQKAIIYGMVAVGPVANATVRAYQSSAGVKGPVLGTTTTDAQGMYYLFVAPQQAPVIIEAAGGTYRDPASGIEQPLAVDLHSVVPSATAMTVASVTVYSDAVATIASSSAGGYTTSNVLNATTHVATQLPVHPIKLLPIDTSKTSQVGWTQQRLAYGTLNGAASQYLIEKPEAELRTVVSTFASSLAIGNFMVEPNIAIAMNNYGANPENVTGYGAATFAGASIDNSCLGQGGSAPTYCPQKPQLQCTAPKVPVNGLCMMPNTTPVDLNAVLAKTWKGPWQWKGRTAGPGCLVDDTGMMTMTVQQNGKDITGTVSVSGIQSVDSNCKVSSTTSSASGTITGTLVQGKIAFNMDIRADSSTLSFGGVGTLQKGILSGTIKRSTGGSGFFNLH